VESHHQKQINHEANTCLPINRTARNSRPLEVLGTYDPIPKPDPYDKSGKLHKDIQLDTKRARYWIGVGAQPTDIAWRLLSMVGVLPPKVYEPKKAQPALPIEVDKVDIR
jgi:small subunit ribosomal protein S16